MNDNEHPQRETDRSDSISARNIKHLLTGAYAPEDPDDLFAARVSEKMLTLARSRAERRSRWRRRAAWRSSAGWRRGALAAAVVVLIAMGLSYWVGPAGSPVQSGSSSTLVGVTPGPSQAGSVSAAPTPATGAMTAQKRPPVPLAPPVGVGSVVHTELGERRRLVLGDGAVVYVNQNTTMNVTDPRRLTVYAGEVYVEVPPLATAAGPTGETFVIRTPDREVIALGTHLGVQVAPEATGVIVTQGKVRVSGFGGLLHAGQHLIGEDGRVADLPRATHVLDWARDLMAAAEPPLVPPSKYAGGALVAKDAAGGKVDLSLRTFHVDVHVEDGFARTTIDQTYFNHASSRLEGTFYFPLPPDASLSRLAMYVDGKLNEGGMVERQRARQVYQSVKEQMKDPALLEWVDGTTFKMRVFPLEARQEKRIILSYTQRLGALYGRTTYRFPAGHTMKAVGRWSFHARLRNAAKTRWSCDSHVMGATVAGGDLLLDAQAADVRLDRDVVVRLPDYAPGAGAAGEAKFSSAAYENERYFMVRFRPKLPTTERREKRHWVFLFESSADRDPLLARTQIDVVRGMLSNAEHKDTFLILAAGTGRTVYPKRGVARATRDGVHRAVAFLEGVQLIGSLDLAGALEAAAPLLIRGSNAHLVHVGSALPVLGDRDEAALLRRVPDDVTYVGVGVGKRWSRSFMKSAAAKTGGYYTQINPDEKVAWRAFELLSTLNTPRLLNVRVDVASGAAGTFLTHNESLAQGEELCAILKTDQSAPLPDVLTVHGMLGGKNWTVDVPVGDVAGGANYLPRIWTRLEIDRLLAEDRNRNHDRIVTLSKAMYVMSPFTSLLVLENEKMYREYNVDRGRKDHWALYPCPETITVVPEPLPAPITPTPRPVLPPPTVRRDWRASVLRTLPVRVHSPLLQPAGRLEDVDYVTTGLQGIETTVSVPDGGTLLLGGNFSSEAATPVLSKIPTLSRVFTNQGAVRNEDTVLLPPGHRRPDGSGLGTWNYTYNGNVRKYFEEDEKGRRVSPGSKSSYNWESGSEVTLHDDITNYLVPTSGSGNGTVGLKVDGYKVVPDLSDSSITVNDKRYDVRMELVDVSGKFNVNVAGGVDLSGDELRGLLGTKEEAARGWRDFRGGLALDSGTADVTGPGGLALRDGDLRRETDLGLALGAGDVVTHEYRGRGRNGRDGVTVTDGKLNINSASADTFFRIRGHNEQGVSRGEVGGKASGLTTLDDGKGSKVGRSVYNLSGGFLNVNGAVDSGVEGHARGVVVRDGEKLGKDFEQRVVMGMVVPPTSIQTGDSTLRLGESAGAAGTYLIRAGSLATTGGAIIGQSGAGAFMHTGGTHTVDELGLLPDTDQDGVANGYINGSGLLDASDSIRLEDTTDGGAMEINGDYASQSMGESPIARLEKIRRIRRGDPSVEFERSMSRSREALIHADTVDDFEDAEVGALLAGNVLEVNKGLYPVEEYRRKRAQVAQQLQTIQRSRELSWGTTGAAQRGQAPGEKPRDKQHDTSALTTRARDLTLGYRYDDARKELERVVERDPANAWAIEQKGKLEEFVTALGDRGVPKRMTEQERKSLMAVREAQIPWYKELTYPRDWNDPARRDDENGRGPAVRARLGRRLDKINFDNTEFSDTVRFLRDVSGLKVDVKWDALSASGVEPTTPVNVRMRGTSVDEALRGILDDVGGVNPVGYTVENGVVTITSQEDLQSRTVTRVYDIRDLATRVPQFQGPRTGSDPEGSRPADVASYAGKAGGGLFAEEGEELDVSKDVEGIVDLVSETIAPDSWADETRVGMREQNGMLIVTQSPDGHRAVSELLGQLREARGIDGRSLTERRRLEGRLGRPDALSRESLLYQRPVFGGSGRWLTDLTLYADGLRTTRADVLAALAAAAPTGHRPRRGMTEPGARKFLEAVRQGGWQRVRLGAGAASLIVDRAGRFVMERTRPGTPAERVICDGRTLLHVYGEIGLAGRRTVSRFHRAELAAAVPWLVPPADDLTVGANVTLVDDRTVAVTPLDGRAKARFATHLVFTSDGRLAERRRVATSDGRTVRRLTFSPDGRVRLLSAGGNVLSERRYEVAAAAAPNLAPNLSALVVLPVPQRWTSRLNWAPETVAKQCPGWSEADAMSFLAAAALSGATTNPAKGAWAVIQKRFLDRGDRRLGFYVLAAATDKYPAVPREHAGRPVGRYLAACTQFAKGKNPAVFDNVGSAGQGFVQDLGRFRRLWHTGQDKAARGKAAWHNEVLGYARVAGTTPLTWALLAQMASHASPGSSAEYPKLVEAFERFRDVPGMNYAARYEAARVLHKLNDPKARERFAGLFIDALRSGVLPAVDEDFHAATAQDGTWRRLIDVTLGALLSRRAYSTAAVLAWQVHHAGDAPLAVSVLARTRSAAPPTLQWALAMAALRLTSETRQWAEADGIISTMLASRRSHSLPWLWRLGAHIAAQRERTASAAGRMGVALEIEHSLRPKDGNLPAFRADHTNLLQQYGQLATSMATLHPEPPRQVVEGIVRTADRWRSLDADPSQACRLAAAALRQLGAKELAWAYLTTPMAGRSGEPSQWVALAAELAGQNEPALADRAYVAAFQSDPDNAQILWDRAQLLQRNGQDDRARQIYRRIVEGRWPEKHKALQQQAKVLLGG